MRATQTLQDDTVDALMAAMPLQTNTTWRLSAYEASGGSIVEYYNTSPTSQPVMPTMPPNNDTLTQTDRANPLFLSLLTTACSSPLVGPITVQSDHRALAASMNNRLATSAHRQKFEGIYMRGFPDKPPVFFDFTNESMNTDPALTPLVHTLKGTKVTKRLWYREPPAAPSRIQFYVLAQGLGNYNKSEAVEKYNLVDTAGAEHHRRAGRRMALGWPRLSSGNGPTPDTILPPPPPDYPKC
ncbi:Laccase-24 [Ananas comosus]|uniref:Laccase-24 n=1 Tax=Ananas comosus TaxID=4615 RepID=A0A199VLV2_ANACO|nr:Laccase-24 [Ananas comosus]